MRVLLRAGGGEADKDITDRLNTTVTEAGSRAQDRSAYRGAVADATCRRHPPPR